MNITIKTTPQDLIFSARDLIEGKLSSLDKLLERTTGPVSLSCEVEESIAVERSGARYRAEGNLSVNGQLFRAEATSNTLEGAVDQVRDELTREVQSAHGKRRSLLKRGGAALKRMLRGG